jgi:uncharacterized membrane-anchored protein
MTPARLAALLLVAHGPAAAQAWRADAEALALDGGILLALIAGGVAFFHIRACWQASQARGHWAAFAWCAMACAAAVFPAARVPLAALAVVFLAYGFCRVT